MEIRKLAIAGTNKIGSQIAWQSAYNGLEVVVYDPFAINLEAWRQSMEDHADYFEIRLGASPAQVYMTQTRISFTSDLLIALKGCDLVHECYTNMPHLKHAFYMELPRLIGLDTIVTTNSTSLTSLHIAYIIALDRFLGLQFNMPIWTNKLVEIATLPQTENAIKDAIDDFVANIEMIPMHVTIATAQADNDSHSQLVGWP